MISIHFVRWPFSVVAILAVMSSSRASPGAGPETITNGIGMKLVLVPAGKFMTGSAREEIRHWNDLFKRQGQGLKIDNEGPLHRVRITRPFYLGVYHVTVGQFRKFVTDAGFQTDAEKGAHQAPRHGYRHGPVRVQGGVLVAESGFQAERQRTGGVRELERCRRVRRLAGPQRAEGLPAAHGSRVGICLPSGNNNEVLFWQRDRRPGRLCLVVRQLRSENARRRREASEPLWPV